ncbi:hypothetical protein [Flavobacterium sp.]|uniref:hypothetical protein n=1 Tax=Flavobacterium sp. TaxID=239 RepID=UPI00391D1983
MKRICIYPKDVQNLTGKGERQSRNIILEIKKKYNKEKHQPITIHEFCDYMNFDVEKVTPLIR